jgi:hypothetical protein
LIHHFTCSFHQQFYKLEPLLVADVLNATPRYSSHHISQLAKSDDVAPTTALIALSVSDTSPAAATLQVVTDDTIQFDASNTSNRVFTVTAASLQEHSNVQLHLPTAAVQHIKVNYIEPMKQRAKTLERVLQQQQSEAILAKHMSELVYLSPMYISTDAYGKTTEHSVTYNTHISDDGVCNSSTIDESKHPHIVFHLVPYSDEPNEVIANDVLCGYRGDDKLAFVIRLPQDVASHRSMSAKEVSIHINMWLSEQAGFELDMFILPDNWLVFFCDSQLFIMLANQCRYEARSTV